jgi:RNA polymerase sigma-70 factor (ECF subfamily)
MNLFETAENKSADCLTDAQMVVAARAGNRGAFAGLVDRHQTAVFRMIFYRIHSHMDAEDLTQEIFMRAFARLRGLKDPQRFRSWLFAIAVNCIRDFKRKQMVKGLFGLRPDTDSDDPLAGIQDSGPSPQDQVMRQDFWKQVRSFLDQLPRMEREIFLLRFWDHLGLREIAEVLGKSQSTVKTHLYRALGKFKQSATIALLLQEDERENQP